jgi:hypothetical protein
MTEVIIKVHLRKDNIKYLIIPKKSLIKEGEYVVVSNNLNLLKKIQNGG